jgi:hypothetical protein
MKFQFTSVAAHASLSTAAHTTAHATTAATTTTVLVLGQGLVSVQVDTVDLVVLFNYKNKHKINRRIMIF